MIVTVGELLWDLLPSGARLGGAPANVAFHAARLGARAALISRVGADDWGQRAKSAMERAGVDVSAVDLDPEHPTGQVLVAFEGQEPRYEICADAAWDHIDLGPHAKALLASATFICLGTLASRTRDQARKLLSRLDEVRENSSPNPSGKRPRVLVDLNLRPPFVDPKVTADLVGRADVLKVNQEESAVLESQLGHPIQRLVDSGSLQLLVCTHGSGEARLISPEGVVRGRPLPPDAGGDAVGAGDAFVAALCVALSAGASLEDSLTRALAEGTHIAGRVGAMPGVSA